MALPEVYIISGFPGSGKTTLLQHILNWKIDLSNTIILINEFGEISIDGILIDSKGIEVLELLNGCICCSIKGELIKSLEEGLNRFNPNRILVETTGVADTLEIVDILSASSITDKIVIKSVICVLDAELWEERENFGSVFLDQVKAANLVLLNKVDLIENNKITLFVEDISRFNQNSIVVPTYRCIIEPEVLFHGSKFISNNSNTNPNLRDEVDNLKYMSFVYKDNEPLSEECFRDFLKNVPSNVFRIKGIVEFASGSFIINYVAGRSEWIRMNEKANTVLVFVGWSMEIDNIYKILNTCKTFR